MSVARFESEILDSQIKRGEVDPETFTRTAHVACGCGAEGCMFITRWKKEENK